MSLSEHNENAFEEPFSLTVDQYGFLWLHAKIEGMPVMFELAEKDTAFGIMAAAMSANDYVDHSVLEHEAAVNDDQITPTA